MRAAKMQRPRIRNRREGVLHPAGEPASLEGRGISAGIERPKDIGCVQKDERKEKDKMTSRAAV
jgi:hypothetical protein